MKITDEPIRGQVPPAWFGSLSGIDRLEAFNRKWLPYPPATHLTGLKPAHVGPGSGTWIMPASPWLGNVGQELEMSQLAAAAMYGAALSTLPPGMDVRLAQVHFDHFRPGRAESGNLVARARVINANRFFVYSTVEVEDAQGRLLAAGSSFSETIAIQPEPPPPPAKFAAIEAPIYPSPDPWARPCDATMLPRYSETDAELQHWHERLKAGQVRIPFQQLFGLEVERVGETVMLDGVITFRCTANDWFALFRRAVDPIFVTTLLNAAAWSTAPFVRRPEHDRGFAIVGLSQHVEIIRDLPADGRPIRIETRVDGQNADIYGHSRAEMFDADGNLVATHIGYVRSVQANLRRRATRISSAKRSLYTLLFTDIVGSTEQLARLGDAKWREALEEHHRRVRAEIARCGGTEVDTQGDGFFARFASPAQALDCARAVRSSVKPMGLELRQGLHTGECEEHGADLAGMAVHLASRIQGKAGAGEILVSSTVKDLVTGSGLKFADRGEHELKGIEGTWRLYALEG